MVTVNSRKLFSCFFFFFLLVNAFFFSLFCVAGDQKHQTAAPALEPHTCTGASALRRQHSNRSHHHTAL